MLSDLINYFSPIESQDRLAFLSQVSEMFDDYGHVAVQIDTSLLLDDCRANSELANQVWDRAYVIIERAMDEMLVGMGLNVEHATIQFKLDLLNACKTIEVTDMHEFVYESATNDSVPITERFETLVEFALGRPVPELMDFVESVPLTLMNRIYLVHKSFIENAPPPDFTQAPDYTKEIARIRNFFKYCKDRKFTLRIHDLVAAGVKPLMRAEFLLSNNLDYLTDLEPEAPDQAAMELVGMLLLCDIDFTNIGQEVSHYADLYFTDTDFIARLNSQATEIISGSNIIGDVSASEEIKWTNSSTLDWL